MADRDRSAEAQRGRGHVHRLGPSRTFVELEQRALERHGEGWEAMRDAVGSPNGWSLDSYATAVERGD